MGVGQSIQKGGAPQGSRRVLGAVQGWVSRGGQGGFQGRFRAGVGGSRGFGQKVGGTPPKSWRISIQGNLQLCWDLAEDWPQRQLQPLCHEAGAGPAAAPGLCEGSYIYTEIHIYIYIFRSTYLYICMYVYLYNYMYT